MEQVPVFTIVVVLLLLIILGNAIRILREYERGVIFRLGRMIGVKGPGLILLIPIIDKMVKVSLRSKGDYDVNQVARVFGGGGHRNASGCSLDQDLDSAEKAILNEMRRVF